MENQARADAYNDASQVAPIDVALSGGGFRATLFHLGVIIFMRKCGLLRRVKNICSVSGGSILAAHLVIHWRDYAGDDERIFERRVKQLVESIMHRDVSRKVLRQSKSRILRSRPLNSEYLAQEYRVLLESERRWDELDRSPDQDHPQLHIVATHLNTGQPGAFTKTGFVLLPGDEGHRHANEIKAFAEFAKIHKISHQDIARAVACSSAFPPVFSPIPLVPEHPRDQLTDGGVYDNSGVKYLEYLYKTNQWTGSDRVVIMSDAGSDFPPELGGQYQTLIALALRVIDTQGNRIAQSDSVAARSFFETERTQFLEFSIHDTIERPPPWADNHTDHVQVLLRLIRTELDKFSAEEVFVLCRHGYLVAQEKWTLSGHGIIRDSISPIAQPWMPSNELRELDRGELERQLANSHVIRKINHPWAYMVIAALFCAASLFAVGGFLLGSRLAPSVPQAVATRGTLSIEEVEPYNPDGWAASIPTLTPVLQSSQAQYAYTIASEPIGNLTRLRRHAAAKARVELTAALNGVELYLFLEQGSPPGEVKRVVLEEVSTKQLRVPSGDRTDRIVGVLVSQKEITGLPGAVIQNITIRLEIP